MSEITFDISRLVPRFLFKDKNGHAISKGIEAAFNYVVGKVEEGISTIQDHDAMPEWRLDELASDYNILYDYTAEIETKRRWIKNAMQFYLLYGTAAGIVEYLEAAFNHATVEEWFEYGGDPFHFRVVATGEWSEDAEAWARKSIEAVKNVRSVLDTITFNVGNVSAPLLTLMAPFSMDITDEAQMI